MKNKAFTLGCFLLAIFFSVVSVTAAPKKKGTQGRKEAITCADIWEKKTKDFKGKTVKTFVLDIGATGTVMSDAVAAVIPVETGDKNKDSGGRILVLVSPADFNALAGKIIPKETGDSSAFGKKIDHQVLSAVFEIIGGESVLLVNLKADALGDFSPSKALKTQNGGEGESPPSTLPEGFERKIFYISKIGKKPYTAGEFKRLLALYNKSRKKEERLKESEAKDLLETEGNSLVVLDEKAKTEWILRK